MKINIFPEFHLKEYEDDLKNENMAFYKGNNKIAEFIVNNSLYWVSTLISLGLLLLLANYFQFAPFGEKSMFVMDGTFFNLPILTNMIHSIQNGTFHFFTLNGTGGAESLSTIAFYLSSPFTLVTLFFDQSTAVSLLTIFTIIRIAASAPFMIYYLTHRENGRKGSKYDPSLLIFALGYSLSTYSLIQFNDFMYMDIFMLFPLFLLGIERIQTRGNWKLFYVIASISLFSNFYLGITILFFGIFIFFFQSLNSPYKTCKNFLYYLLACICSLCTSAITVVPGVIGLTQRMAGTNSSPNFEMLIHPLSLYLQQLFFTDPSYYHTVISSCNVYIGLFTLMLAFLHFLNTQKSLKRRIIDFFFFVILVAFVSISSLQYYSHLLFENNTSFNNYCFILFTILIIWGFEAFKDLRKIPFFNVVLSCILPIGVTLLAMNMSPTKPNFQSVTYSIDLFILYSILILLYRLGSIKREAFYSIIIAIAVVELMANAFQSGYCLLTEESTVKDVIIADEAGNSDSIFTDGRSEIFLGENTPESLLLQLNSRNSNNSIISSDLYISSSPLDNAMANVNKQYVNDIQKENFNAFPQYKYSDTKGEYEVFDNSFKLPFSYLVSTRLKKLSEPNDYVLRQNEIAKNLGAKEDLFQKADMDVSLSVPDNVTYEKLKDQVYSLSIIEMEDVNRDSYLVTFYFKPKKSGDLFIDIYDLEYFGKVEAGKTYTYYFNLYNQTDCIWNVSFDGFLYSYAAQDQIMGAVKKNKCNAKYNGTNAIQISTEANQDSTLLTSISYSDRLRVKVDGNNVKTGFDYNGYLAVPISKGIHSVTVSYMVWPLWTGLVLSSMSLLALCFSRLLRKKNSKRYMEFAKNMLFRSYDRIYHGVKENYVYVLAFIIPFLIFMIALVISGSQPFGTETIFVSDGQKLDLPSLFGSVNHFKEHFSTGIFKLCDTCFSLLFSLKFLYCFIPVRYLTTVLTFVTIAKISLGGVNLVFYLTHRLQGTAANKKDLKLLVPALCYSLCCYMIIMICYWSWYNVLMLVPLVIYGMDYLIIKGKKRYYILFLSLTVFLMYYVSIFLCIYLVIRFFTYHFESIKDFIRKGIRFAFCSLSVLGLEYFILYTAFTSLTGSTYGQKDSKAPSWYFFTGFDSMVYQMGFLKKAVVISWNEGDALLYFGMLPVFLLFFYLFSRKITWKDKLQQLIPWAIIFFTMNNSVLNYVFNGFHYQHGVPNRFAFLLIFISATISYDAIRNITQEKLDVIIASFVTIIIIFSLSFWIGKENNRSIISYIATIAMICIYFIVFLLYRTKKFKVYSPVKGLIFIFCIELAINTSYQYYLNHETIVNLTYEQDGIRFIKSQTNVLQTLDRTAIIAPICESYYGVTPIRTMQMFNAGSITSYQINMAKLCNYYTDSNIITYETAPMTLGNALANNKYIVLNHGMETLSAGSLENYDIIGKTDNSVIFENNNVFPYGYYLPNSFKSVYDKELTYDSYYNMLFEELTDTEQKYIEKYRLFYDTKNGYDRVLSMLRQKITFGYQDIRESLFKNPYISVNDLRNYDVNNVQISKIDSTNYEIDYNIKIPKNGSLYVQWKIPYYYGDHKKGDLYSIEADIHLSGSNLKEKELKQYYIVNEELVDDLCQSINKNALKIDNFTDKSLNGTINMPEDGIVCISTPYKEQWHVYVDGTEVKTNALANAFLSFEAPKGNHEIHLIDKSGNNSSAVVITILSWMLFIMCCILKDKQIKKKH